MKVFLTGATGFIGARLMRRLVRRGDDVVILRRESSDTSLIDDLLTEASVSEVIGGLHEPELLRAGMADCDAVIHTAGDVSYWKRDRARQRHVNVDGTRHVLEAARSAGVARVLYTSSVAAVGIPAGREPADETNPWLDDWSWVGYFETKRAAEGLALAAVAAGQEVVIVNPAYVIGPGDVRLHDGNIFIDLHRGTIPLCPPGGNCWVDVDDVVEGHLLALARGVPGERYILGGENLSYRHVMEHVAGLLNVRAPFLDLNPLLAAVATPVYELLGALQSRYPRMTWETAFLFHQRLYYSSAKAETELGYIYRPFEEIARRTVSWYREHGTLPEPRDATARCG